MVNDTAEIGIFGGTGIYDSEMLRDSKEVTIETPYGKTSDTITIGELNGKKIAFMPRHGKKHSIPPHMINYCANIWAFKELGITRIISPSAVGSLKEEIKPGDFVLPTQFIDFTKKLLAELIDKMPEDFATKRTCSCEKALTEAEF